MFITGVCLLFLLKLKWPKNKSVYKKVKLAIFQTQRVIFGEFQTNNKWLKPFVNCQYKILLQMSI